MIPFYCQTRSSGLQGGLRIFTTRSEWAEKEREIQRAGDRTPVVGRKKNDTREPTPGNQPPTLYIPIHKHITEYGGRSFSPCVPSLHGGWSEGLSLEEGVGVLEVVWLDTD